MRAILAVYFSPLVVVSGGGPFVVCLLPAKDDFMAVDGLAAELRLDRGRMDSIFMKALPDLASNLHVPLTTLALEFEIHLDMQTRDQLCVRQLPDVQVVARANVGKRHDVLFDVLNVEPCWDGLQQDSARCFAQWYRGAQNDHCYDQRYHWIGVEAPLKVCQPDEERSCYHADVAECVA